MEKGSSSSSSSSGSGTDSLNYGDKIGGVPAVKRGRNVVVQQGGQPPRCQVEGCQVDLSDAKAYYSRHKVCGMHSKSPTVIVGGLHQRFCQQCSRFHQLPEFDQGKRSCRRRLAGHNERRRKPPPGTLLPSHYRSLSPSAADGDNKTGGLVIDFGSYHLSSETQSWLDTTSEWGMGNQAAVYELPLPRSPRNSFADLLHVSTAQPGYYCLGASSEKCLGEVSNTASALSLLSNKPWIPTGESSNFLDTNSASAAGVHQLPGNPGSSTSQFLDLSWGYKDNQAYEMLSGTGLGQGSHWDSSQHSLSLARSSDDNSQLGRLGSDDDSVSVQHMHWSC